MSKEIEIEKKYRVKKLPENLNDFEHITIEQSYINNGGSPIRIRKFISANTHKYIISKKARIKEGSFEFVENNLELPEEVYQGLLEFKEGRTIIKTRYKIPLQDGLKLDLDVFHGFFEGVCVAEIEYESVQQANDYKVPAWLGEELTNAKKLANVYMATQVSDISEYDEYMQAKNN